MVPRPRTVLKEISSEFVMWEGGEGLISLKKWAKFQLILSKP